MPEIERVGLMVKSYIVNGSQKILNTEYWYTIVKFEALNLD